MGLCAGYIFVGSNTPVNNNQTIYFDYESHDRVYLLESMGIAEVQYDISPHFQTVKTLDENYEQLKSTIFGSKQQHPPRMLDVLASEISRMKEQVISIKKMSNPRYQPLTRDGPFRVPRYKRSFGSITNRNLTTLVIKIVDKVYHSFGNRISNLEMRLRRVEHYTEILRDNSKNLNIAIAVDDLLEHVREVMRHGYSIIRLLSGNNLEITTLIHPETLAYFVSETILSQRDTLGYMDDVAVPLQSTMSDLMYMIKNETTRITLAGNDEIHMYMRIPWVKRQKYHFLHAVPIPFTLENATAEIVPKYPFALLEEELKVRPIRAYSMTSEERFQCHVVPSQVWICERPTREKQEFHHIENMHEMFAPGCSSRKQFELLPANNDLCGLHSTQLENAVMTIPRVIRENHYYVYVVKPFNITQDCAGTRATEECKKSALLTMPPNCKLEWDTQVKNYSSSSADKWYYRTAVLNVERVDLDLTKYLLMSYPKKNATLNTQDIASSLDRVGEEVLRYPNENDPAIMGNSEFSPWARKFVVFFILIVTLLLIGISTLIYQIYQKMILIQSYEQSIHSL